MGLPHRRACRGDPGEVDAGEVHIYSRPAPRSFPVATAGSAGGRDDRPGAGEGQTGIRLLDPSAAEQGPDDVHRVDREELARRAQRIADDLDRMHTAGEVARGPRLLLIGDGRGGKVHGGLKRAVEVHVGQPGGGAFRGDPGEAGAGEGERHRRAARARPAVAAVPGRRRGIRRPGAGVYEAGVGLVVAHQVREVIRRRVGGRAAGRFHLHLDLSRGVGRGDRCDLGRRVDGVAGCVHPAERHRVRAGQSYEPGAGDDDGTPGRPRGGAEPGDRGRRDGGIEKVVR